MGTKKKVKKIELALNKAGQPEYYVHKESGKTIYSSIITFEDNSIGTFNHEGKTQDYFKVGEEAEFNAENKGTWWKLSRVKKSEWKNRPSGWIPKSGAEIKREGITFVLGDVTKLVIADKISEGEMVSRFHELIDAFFAAVDKVKDE